MSDVVDVALQAVYQRGIVHSGMFFLLTEKVMIFGKAHRALLVSVAKIGVCIFSFKEIVTQATQLLKILFEAEKGAKAFDSILTYEIVSFLFNNELRLSICYLLTVSEISVVIHVQILS